MKGSMVEAKGFVVPSLHSQPMAADCFAHAAPRALHDALHHGRHLRCVEDGNASRLEPGECVALAPLRAPPWLE